jgi:hypothetical protein
MFDGKVRGDGLFDSLISRIRLFQEGRSQEDDVSMLEVIAAPFDLPNQGTKPH